MSLPSLQEFLNSGGLTAHPSPFETECPICQNPHQTPVKLPCACRITTCRNCIVRWLTENGSCTLCRNAFVRVPNPAERIAALMRSQDAPNERFGLDVVRVDRNYIPSDRLSEVARVRRYNDYFVQHHPQHRPRNNDTKGFLDFILITNTLVRGGNTILGRWMVSGDPLTDDDKADLDQLVQMLFGYFKSFNGQSITLGALAEVVNDEVPWAFEGTFTPRVRQFFEPTEFDDDDGVDEDRALTGRVPEMWDDLVKVLELVVFCTQCMREAGA